MGLSEAFRGIQQARLDAEHDAAAPDGCLAYFRAWCARIAARDEWERYDVATFPNVPGWANRTPPILGYIGEGMSESRFVELRDAVRGQPARRGVAGLPAWAVREILALIARCGEGVTLAMARAAYVADARAKYESLPPLGEKPAGFDEWMRGNVEADETTEWTEDDDDRLGQMLLGQ